MQYDLRILEWQCYNCNINYGGMGAEFWHRLTVDIGKQEADALYLECAGSKGRPVTARDWYNDLIEKYKTMV
jgi:hypothetical protein